jgi:hypothetical protein
MRAPVVGQLPCLAGRFSIHRAPQAARKTRHFFWPGRQTLAVREAQAAMTRRPRSTTARLSGRFAPRPRQACPLPLESSSCGLGLGGVWLQVRPMMTARLVSSGAFLVRRGEWLNGHHLSAPMSIGNGLRRDRRAVQSLPEPHDDQRRG